MINLGLPGNYFRIAIRTLLKNRLATLVNLTGLTTGLAGILLIGLFVLDELSYDRHYKYADQLYRITSTYVRDGQSYNSAQTYGDVASSLDGLPEIQQVVRVMPEDEGFLFIGKKAFKEKIRYTDPEFIQVFDLDLVKGDPTTCLKNPSSLLISESCALRFFGKGWKNASILGMDVALDGRITMTITGVFRDIPRHSHIRSDLLGSLPSGHEDWMRPGSKVYTYALVHEEANLDNLRLKVQDLSSSMMSETEGHQVQLNFKPVTDIYLFSSLEDENAAQGDLKNIYSLLLAALFLIVTTVTNFVNLNAAYAFRRLKEVGIRKVLGSYLWQLRAQFLMETTIISTTAMCVALGCVTVALPLFNQLTGKNLLAGDLMTFNVLVLITGLTIGISLLAGLFPSAYISTKRAADALRGAKGSVSGTLALQRGLVVFQFAISCIMIILSTVAVRQVNLINSKPLGFDKQNTIVLANPYMLGSTAKITGFRNELMTLDGVENVSITGYTPFQERWGNLRLTFPDRDVRSSYAHPANWLMVDEGFLGTMGIQLIAGRDFLEIHEHDKGSIIVNETAVGQFGLNEDGKDPIGAELSVRNEDEDRNESFRIVGVVRDFNFGSLHEPVKPIVMKLGYHRFEMALNLSSIYPTQQTIEEIGAIWSKTLPAIPFEYSYIKDRYDRLHASDTAASRLFLIFCFSTIVISVLGLFSIVAYEIATRKKEIGIRKLLGATVWNISAQLSRRFLMLVSTAYFVALPFSWMLAREWIADFAYQTEISWVIFVVAGVAIFVVAVLTLGYQSIRASMANPIDNLRQE